jgi:hypothetical protein
MATRLQPHGQQQLCHALLYSLTAQALVHHQRLGDDLSGSHARVERTPGVLKDRLHSGPIAAQGSPFKRLHLLTLEDNPPRRYLLQAHDELRRRRLATARFAHQADGFMR